MNLQKLKIALKKCVTITVVLLIHCLLHAQSGIPSARHLSHMIYDEQNKQILLYGGSTGGYSYSDLWALDSTGWKKLAENGPSGRIKGAFVFDTDRKKAILFGGSGPNNKLLDDTWEWDGITWKQSDATGPVARNHSMAAYDKKNKVVVMYGGVGPNGLLSDTWIFDGLKWKQADTNGPKDCLPHGMVYNEATGKVILITLSVIREPKDEAHAVNSMWEWTGNSWKKFPDSASFVTSSNLQSLSVFGDHSIVLFDGSDVADGKCKTWAFAQSLGENRSIEGPSGRFGHAMAFDKSRGITVLFGGFSNGKLLNDLWTWDSHKWTEMK
jgi:hypothetical protein